ncbi:tetratricopeptide repeat protein [Streptomyces atriruber]|uniref:Tetratricopeptide repeat protein n=1 Tax=Streptomyces atriruber TaxID=545121 RepID=A0ABV3BIM2_9ACTN
MRDVQGLDRGGWLPAEPSGFVGREREVDLARTRLASHRLVTLRGPGGVGKTRIAWRVAARTDLPHGSRWVDLASVREGSLVGQAVITALGLQDQTGRSSVEVLAENLAEQDVLLVLDTCEHLIDECASLTDALLEAVPGLRILATSRAPLGVRHESVVPIGPMSTGPDGDALVLLKARAERASEPTPNRVPSQDAPAELVGLCDALEGIPLAIELAAPHLRTVPARQLSRQLTERLDLLSPETPSDTDLTVVRPRHAGLRTTIGWSHEWCSPHERLLWARLSVFPGSFTMPAMEFVCTIKPLFGYDLTDTLGSLVSKSVVLREGAPGARRYRMLDTVREYGAEWLERLGQHEDLQLRHRDFYRHLAMTGGENWLGPQQPELYRQAAAEHANVRAALQHCLRTDVSAALRMAADLFYFWFACGNLREGRHFLEAALALDPQHEPGRARALWVCAVISSCQGDHRAALERAAEALELATRTADGPAQAWATYAQGLALTLQGDTDPALERLSIALPLAETVHEDIAGLLCMASTSYLHMALGELDRAQDLAERVIARAAPFEDIWAQSFGHYVVGTVDTLRGRPDRAIRSLRTALEAKWLLNDAYGIGITLDTLALAAIDDGQAEWAAWLLGLGDQVWRKVGVPQLGAPDMVARRATCEQRTLAALPLSAYEAHHRAGFTLDTTTAEVPARLRDPR